MNADAGSGEADLRAYVRVAGRVRRQIMDGTLAGRPPSITTLKQETGHSRHTIAHAFRLLEQEGLLARTSGHGYHVTAPAGDTAGGECE